MLVLGYLEPDSIMQLEIVPLLAWLLPQFLFISILGNHISKELEKSAVYIFTRSSKRYNWLIKRYSELFIYIILCYIIFFVAIILFGCVMHLNFNFNDFYVLLLVFIIQVVSTFCVVLIINSINLYLKITFSYIVFFSVYLFQTLFIGMNLSNKSIMMTLPFPRTIIGWQNNDIIRDIQMENNFFYIKELNLSSSILYFFILSLIIIFTNIILFKRRDII
ncbi:DUF2705 family protein [Bacillus sp. NPDC077027]|uniref:DUF2705 family protein n=1 Tax=Bacillus sp. NPDC077027 TaxID=3390548 RepID=UPI003CFC7707